MGLMASGPAALDGSRPASSFKIPVSDISICGISGTLDLNVPGMFSSLREPLASPSSMVFSESWSSLRGETGVNTDCKWLLIKFARSVLDVWTSLVWGSRRGPIACESWHECFQKKKKIAFLMQTWIDLSCQRVRYLGQDCLCQANPPSSYHMRV